MAIIENHQHIYGSVGRDGNKWFGEGFISRKLKEGTYLIEFERPFREMPTPVCTIMGPEWLTFDKSVAIVDISPNHFICVTSTPHRPADCDFTFIVFGDI